MFEVNNNTNTSAISTLTEKSNSKLESTLSVQLLFAALQLELAQANKDKALEKMEGIKDAQTESKLITDSINQLRNMKDLSDEDLNNKCKNLSKVKNPEEELQVCDKYLAEAKELQAQAKAGEEGSISDKDSQAFKNFKATGEKESTMMSTEMENFFKEGGLSYDSRGVSRRQNAKEWDQAITSLENREELLSLMSVLEKYNIEWPEGDLIQEDLDTLIASLESSQETVSADIQQEMIYVQDFMSQYNSYLQGSSSAISAAGETLKTIARG